MTRASAPVRQIAWTCLLAVWLAIAAPVVTQLRAAMDVQQVSADLCSTQPDADSHAHDPAAHRDRADSTCGYCDLLVQPLPVLFNEGTCVEAPATPTTLRRYVFAWSRDPPHVAS
jgi:hypothetical protein